MPSLENDKMIFPDKVDPYFVIDPSFQVGHGHSSGKANENFEDIFKAAEVDEFFKKEQKEEDAILILGVDANADFSEDETLAALAKRLDESGLTFDVNEDVLARAGLDAKVRELSLQYGTQLGKEGELVVALKDLILNLRKKKPGEDTIPQNFRARMRELAEARVAFKKRMSRFDPIGSDILEREAAEFNKTSAVKIYPNDITGDHRPVYQILQKGDTAQIYYIANSTQFETVDLEAHYSKEALDTTTAEHRKQLYADVNALRLQEAHRLYFIRDNIDKINEEVSKRKPSNKADYAQLEEKIINELLSQTPEEQKSAGLVVSTPAECKKNLLKNVDFNVKGKGLFDNNETDEKFRFRHIERFYRTMFNSKSLQELNGYLKRPLLDNSSPAAYQQAINKMIEQNMVEVLKKDEVGKWDNQKISKLINSIGQKFVLGKIPKKGEQSFSEKTDGFKIFPCTVKEAIQRTIDLHLDLLDTCYAVALKMPGVKKIKAYFGFIEAGEQSEKINAFRTKTMELNAKGRALQTAANSENVTAPTVQSASATSALNPRASQVRGTFMYAGNTTVTTQASSNDQVGAPGGPDFN
jgi:hypothetical protein